MSFDLHPQLTADTFAIGTLSLCEVRLMNDSRYPWLILVPQVEGIEEAFQLSDEQQQLLQQESSAVGKAIMALFSGDKLNVAALGNVVPQLHIHHIVRFKNDAAWPKPVWGLMPPLPFAAAVKDVALEQLRLHLSQVSGFTAA